ncbi:glutaredoxin [Citricoccus muralis]|uniref:Glutaredoxin n=2 Tax=Citricoccus muralis TaxID=169134 RepID=A0A3D9LFV2_9MICC|nr:glutaredoxin [Citricoccus muralis]
MTIQSALFPAEDNMITVNGTHACVQCAAATRFLDKRDVPYEFIDLDENQAKLAALRADGFQQIPIIETPSERFTGFNPNRLEKAVAEIRAATATQGAVVADPTRALR